MRDLLSLLALPPALLLFISTSPSPSSAAEASWPYDLPPHLKYFPEHEPIVRRNLQAQRKLETSAPQGLRKMSEDESEMFFLEYWQFGESDEGSINIHGNTSTRSEGPSRFQPPLRVQMDRQPLTPNPLYRKLLRAPLLRKGFQCPTGTSSCTSINKPDSCCPTGEQCQNVMDTGLGDVGCCSMGQNCGGQVESCAPGYTACPANLGGGCCVPGYQCAGVGCVLASTATVVVNPTITASPSSSTSTPTPTSTTPSSNIPSSTSQQPITTTRPPTSSTSSVQSTCSTGFQACPATLGGGCCPTGLTCGTAQLCLSTSSSLSSTGLGAPVRPTSVPTTITGTTTISATFPPTTTLPASVCPTGFYQCSAYYRGGACCRVGRDCSLTDCPAATPTTVLASDGVTVAVATAPSGIGALITAGAVVTGSCANGWLRCSASQGGGCCPSGFTCAGVNCVKGVTTVEGTASSLKRAGKFWPTWTSSYLGLLLAMVILV